MDSLATKIADAISTYMRTYPGPSDPSAFANGLNIVDVFILINDLEPEFRANNISFTRDSVCRLISDRMSLADVDGWNQWCYRLVNHGDVCMITAFRA
jgi:hypothetical protein